MAMSSLTISLSFLWASSKAFEQCSFPQEKGPATVEKDAASLAQMQHSSIMGQAVHLEQQREFAERRSQASSPVMSCPGSLWRESVPEVLQHEKLQAKGDIYEFGVFNGGSMQLLRQHFPDSRMWGFDSFSGLPAEARVDWQNSMFQEGAYAAMTTPSKLTSDLGGPSKTGFVVGFYNESLTETLAAERGMSQAMYIDIDADLYTSSFQALDWMFKKGLVRPGTVVGYDDWWVNPCSLDGDGLHPLKTGEGRAHNEVAETYRVKFRCVSGACRFSESEAGKECDWGAIFVVDALGGETVPQHGFEMNEHDMATWKKTNPVCRSQSEGTVHRVSPPSGANRATPGDDSKCDGC